jgi:shikimate dehydrogenase
MHNRAAAALGLDFVYLPLEVDDPPSFFARFVRAATREIEWRLAGASVTIPHKTAVMNLVDEVDESALSAGAVNTIVIKDGRVIGHNTDVAGAIAPLEKVCSLGDKHFAVIGAGGAARAVVSGLVGRGARVTLFARDVAKARPVGRDLNISVTPLDAIDTSDATVVINTTPVGMRGHSEGHSPVSRAALEGRKVAYDLVYNPLETRFLKDALNCGCVTVNGLEMLVAQAALQFRLWTGRDAPADLMRRAALESIERPRMNAD